MNPKQMARAGALGSSFFLAAFVTVLAHVAIAGRRSRFTKARREVAASRGWVTCEKMVII